MQTGGLAFLLGILLALVLALGSCAGINTSQLEETAEDYGIVPIELSEVLDSLGSGFDMNGSSFDSAGGFEDDLFGDIKTSVMDAETAQEAADGAGVESFVDLETLELSIVKDSDSPTTYYMYDEGMATALVIYENFMLTVDKATLAYNSDTFALDDRDFSLEWVETINGIEVDCFGYTKEGVGKAIFTDGTYKYGITAVGFYDAVEFGLSIDDLTVLVEALTK